MKLQRWQVVAMVVVLLLPFAVALLLGPGVSSLEMGVWAGLLVLIAVGPALARRLRRDG